MPNTSVHRSSVVRYEEHCKPWHGSGATTFSLVSHDWVCKEKQVLRRKRITALLGIVGLAVTAVVAAGGSAAASKHGTLKHATYTYPPAFSASALTAPSGVNWIDYGGSNYNDRYSTLNAITTSNVKNLRVDWQATMAGVPTTQTEDAGGLEYGGIYYYGAGNDDIFAYDSSTGKLLWEYTGSQQAARGSTLHGLAMGAGRIYFNEDDDYIVALDARTGHLDWRVGPVGDPSAGETNIAAIEYSDGELFSGTAGSDSGVRGFISAYSAATGAQLWTHYMVPLPGQPGSTTWGEGSDFGHGGGGDWGHISTDPALGQIYVGTANAEPYSNRPFGNDLYTSSLVALSMKTGRMIWYYQMVHHDEWDYDINTTPAVLMNYKLGGKMVAAIDQPTKMGLNFILNRKTGKPFKQLPITETPEPQSPQAPDNSPTQPIPSGLPFAPQCATAAEWIAGGGTTTTGPDGNPIEFGCTYSPIVPSHYTQPGFHDKADYPPTSYSSQTGYVYVCDTLNRGDAYEATPVAKAKAGPGDTGFGTEVSSASNGDWIQGKTGQVVAINPVNNRPVWKATLPDGNGCYSGISTTAGGVLFVGTFNGTLLGYNAKTGALLWQSPQMQGSALNPPVVYQGLDGKEHVTIQAGPGGLTRLAAPGNSVYSFTLPGKK